MSIAEAFYWGSAFATFVFCLHSAATDRIRMSLWQMVVLSFVIGLTWPLWHAAAFLDRIYSDQSHPHRKGKSHA